MSSETAHTSAPTLAGLAGVFAWISLTGFGSGQKAQIRQAVVVRMHWLSEQEFIEALELCELFPGPNVLNLAVFIGQRLRGFPGAVTSLVAGAVPPILIVFAFGAFYFSTFSTPLVHAALKGAASAAVGITFANAVELTLQTGRRPLDLLFIAATAIGVTWFRMPLATTLLVIGGLSISAYGISGRRTNRARS